jgi:hypothetical protein
MNDSKYENYLYDLGTFLKEMALEAKKDMDSSEGPETKNYKTGYCMGFHRVISLMQQQAEAFSIPLKKINLSDIDADRDLI